MSFLDAIREAKPGQTVYDRGEKASVHGLELRAKAASKSFFFYYTTKGGTRRRPKIGEFGQITVAQARSIAKEWQDAVARGRDPQKEWAEAREEMLVRDLFKEVYRIHWDTERYRKSGWAKDVKDFYDKNLHSYFGGLKLSEVTPNVIRSWLLGYEQKKTTGNRSLEILSKMFNFAIEEEIIDISNPCKPVKAFPEIKRDRYASKEEIQAILSRLEFYIAKRSRQALFIYLVLFTGCRPSTLQRATWKDLKIVEVDGKNFGVIRFHGKTTSDSGEKETVVVPPKALELILSYRKRNDKVVGCGWPQNLWAKLMKELNIDDLWMRDLRRTFATVGLSSGESIDTIGEILNHRSTQTTKIYAKLMDGKKLEAVKSISETISAMGKPALKVV